MHRPMLTREWQLGDDPMPGVVRLALATLQSQPQSHAPAPAT